MEPNKVSQETHFSVTTLKILYEWKWHILIATIITLVVAYTISSPIFITPKYSTELIMYPPHTLTAKSLIVHEPKFGSDLDADQHIQLLTSGIIFDSVQSKHNLLEHYEIDTSRERWQERFGKKYNKNINIRRTKFNSIRINVRDKDPYVAADIAWSIAKTGDSFREHLFKTNLKSSLNSIEKEYINQQKIVSHLFETLDEIRSKNFETAFEIIDKQKQSKLNTISHIHENIDKIRNHYGIYDLGEQINLLYEQIVIAHSNYLRDSSKMHIIKEYYEPTDTAFINTKSRLSASKTQYNELSKRLTELTKSNADYSSLLSKIEIELKMLSEIQKDHEEYERSFQKVITDLNYYKNRKQLDTEFDLLLDLRRDLVKAQNNLNQEFLNSYIVQTPGVSSRPSHPKRTIITLLPTILVFFTSCFVALFSSIYIPKLRDSLKNN